MKPPRPTLSIRTRPREHHESDRLKALAEKHRRQREAEGV